MIDIVPISAGHIDSFHQTLDVVARERRYLAFFEAPPLETTRAFVLDMIGHGYPQFVAVTENGDVVGWCDVTPKSRPIYAHAGVLGMGLLPQFRHQGLGTRPPEQRKRDRALQEIRLRHRRLPAQRLQGRRGIRESDSDGAVVLGRAPLFAASFRDGPKGPDPESRDSQVRNCAP
jgi:GNAT superfamily N-acetyltransferase